MAYRYYRIVRYFAQPGKNKRVVNPRCTLADAKAHCDNPETSSQTCTSSYKKAYTRKHGHWFDGYEGVE